MAICDANYKFTMVDISDTGRNSDGGVFSNCNLGIAISENLLNLPKAETIWHGNIVYPFVFVGDEAFPLRTDLMKPYPRAVLGLKERIFNYRLSRSRRIIENTFGILAARFRIFRRPIIAREDVVVSVTKACVVLHNYPPEMVDRESQYGTRFGSWRDDVQNYSGLIPLQMQVASNNYSQDAKTVRENFKDFFSTGDGQVPWQMDSITQVHNSFDVRE